MLERILDEAGDRFRALLTNRRLTTDLQGDQKALELNSLSEGNAGQIVRDSDNSGWDTVSPDSDVEFTFRPTENIIDELESKLYVESRPYRAYSSGGDNNPPFSVVKNRDVSSNLATVSGNGEWQTINSFSPSVSGQSQMFHFYLHVQEVGATYDQALGVGIRLAFDGGNDGYWPDRSGNTPNTLPTGGNVASALSKAYFDGSIAGDFGEIGLIDVEAKLSFFESDEVDLQSEIEIAYDDVHTHPPKPGLTTFDKLAPDNVAIYIDDTEVANGLSAPIDSSIDIKGLLTGDSHTIRATSDTLGHLRVGVTQETIKNAGGP